MELTRRLIFLVLLLAAIWLSMMASLSPLVLVESVDFAKQQKKEGSYMGVQIMTDEKKRLHDMPLAGYIAKKTRGRLFAVQGQEWDILMTNVAAVKAGKRVPKEWSRRLPSDQHAMKVFYFRPDEPPVREFTGSFNHDNDVVYAAFSPGSSGETEYLKMTYRTYSDNDFHFGTGFSRYPTPPGYLLFPYRHFSLLFVFLAILLYIFPFRKAGPSGTIRYPAWRILLCDIVSLLLILPFFAFPFLIIGGSVQAFTVGWPLLFFFWPIAILGIWSLLMAAWFASFSLFIAQDHLEIGTYKEVRRLYYRDMAFFQPCVFKSPRWLVILSWMAAIMGTGASGIGATGRALLVSAAESGCVGIQMKDGSNFYVSITDQIGTSTLKRSGDIVHSLRRGGVEEKTDAKVIQSMGLEIFR